MIIVMTVLEASLGQEKPKRIITMQEAFFQALAATIMGDYFPTYREALQIDETLSEYEAAGIVLVRTLEKDFEFKASARRVAAVLNVFFVDQVKDRFDQELDELLREQGSEVVEDFRPTADDLLEATRLDIVPIVSRGHDRGWGKCGGALKAPYRCYWESQLDA